MNIKYMKAIPILPKNLSQISIDIFPTNLSQFSNKFIIHIQSMADKSKKPEDLNQIDKHLNSKLFQKFLQKEGDKLAEVSILPSRGDPPKKPIKKPDPETRSNLKSKPDPDYYPEPRFKEEKTSKRYEQPYEAQLKSRSKYTEEEEVLFQLQRFNPDQAEPLFRQSSIKSPTYEDRPRSKWQEDPYAYREEETYPRDSELKGFSDYIPPGESFVYFEPVLEKPKPKPNLLDYYPDPLITLSNNNQQVLDLEEKVRSKEMEINNYKQDIEHLKADLQELEERLDSKADIERRLKNMRVEKEMFERKCRGFEEENDEMKRQIQMLREDVENARFKADDIERSFKSKMQDLERELRNSRDRISDLERDLSREKSKNKKSYQDDYQDYDRGYTYNEERPSNKQKYDDYYQDEPRKSSTRKDDYYYEEPRKGNNKGRESYEEEARNSKKKVFYDEPKKKNDDWYNGYSDRGFYDKQADDDFRPEKIKEQVKARIGATNSNSVSSALNWGQKSGKNEEVINIENQILSLQIEKKRYEGELAKIPEHGKKMALIRRREEIEGELAGIHSKIANLKIRAKQIQSKDE